jgi:hypothetical protein
MKILSLRDNPGGPPSNVMFMVLLALIAEDTREVSISHLRSYVRLAVSCQVSMGELNYLVSIIGWLHMNKADAIRVEP